MLEETSMFYILITAAIFSAMKHNSHCRGYANKWVAGAKCSSPVWRGMSLALPPPSSEFTPASTSRELLVLELHPRHAKRWNTFATQPGGQWHN
jgi:hypothetical protein